MGRQFVVWPFGDRIVDRRLRSTAQSLRDLRTALAIVDEQLTHVEDDANDKALRALVSETALASFEHRDAERSRSTLALHRQQLALQIVHQERLHDELLERIRTSG